MTTQNKIQVQRITCNQKEFLINYMGDHIDFAKDKFEGVNGSEKLVKKWGELAAMLNALGGANKSPAQWKKCWIDMKLQMKEKAAAATRERTQSGVNGVIRAIQLNHMEEKILTIITSHSYDGDGVTEAIGLASVAQSHVFPTCSTTTSCSSPDLLLPGTSKSPVPSAQIPKNTSINKKATSNVNSSRRNILDEYILVLTSLEERKIQSLGKIATAIENLTLEVKRRFPIVGIIELEDDRDYSMDEESENIPPNFQNK